MSTYKFFIVCEFFLTFQIFLSNDWSLFLLNLRIILTFTVLKLLYWSVLVSRRWDRVKLQIQVSLAGPSLLVFWIWGSIWVVMEWALEVLLISFQKRIEFKIAALWIFLQIRFRLKMGSELILFEVWSDDVSLVYPLRRVNLTRNVRIQYDVIKIVLLAYFLLLVRNLDQEIRFLTDFWRLGFLFIHVAFLYVRLFQVAFMT